MKLEVKHLSILIVMIFLLYDIFNFSEHDIFQKKMSKEQESSQTSTEEVLQQNFLFLEKETESENLTTSSRESNLSPSFWRFFFYQDIPQINSKFTHKAESRGSSSAKTIYSEKKLSLEEPYDPNSTFFSFVNDANSTSQVDFIAAMKSRSKTSNVHFDLSNLTNIQDNLKSMTKFKFLSSLCLHNCGLTSIPIQLIKLPPTIKYLDLSSNFIKQIPNDVKWEHLEGLTVSCNAFENDWPEIINSHFLPSLTYLDISNNNLRQTPDLNGFSQLQFLNLSFCKLHTFPQWIKQCPLLQVLYLNDNFFNTFECGDMEKINELTILNLSNLKTEPGKKLIPPMPSSLQLLIIHGNQDFEVPIENLYGIIYDQRNPTD